VHGCDAADLFGCQELVAATVVTAQNRHAKRVGELVADRLDCHRRVQIPTLGKQRVDLSVDSLLDARCDERRDALG
jgi:hypothetical protein